MIQVIVVIIKNNTINKNDAGCVKGWKCGGNQIVQYYHDTLETSNHGNVCSGQKPVCKDGIKINGYQQDAECVTSDSPAKDLVAGQKCGDKNEIIRMYASGKETVIGKCEGETPICRLREKGEFDYMDFAECVASKEDSKGSSAATGSPGSGLSPSGTAPASFQRVQRECTVNGKKSTQWCDTGNSCYTSATSTEKVAIACSVTVVGGPTNPNASLADFGNVTAKTCKNEDKSYKQMANELKSANYNGSLDKASILAAYNRTVCPDAPKDCKDNPPVGIDPATGVDRGSRPEGYMWEASCSRACLYNDQKTPDDPAGCPKNTTDPYVNPVTSNWCYGFEGGNRCLMLKYVGNQYRIAGDLATLNAKEFEPYEPGKIIDFLFDKKDLGTKFIYLQYKNEKGEIINANPFPAKIEKVAASPTQSPTPSGVCPVTVTCCDTKLTRCTSGPKNTTECKTPGSQWCYNGYCIKENYSETTKSCGR